MSNSLYKVVPGLTQQPLASDLNQLIDMLNGSNDVGPISVAAPVAAPNPNLLSLDPANWQQGTISAGVGTTFTTSASTTRIRTAYLIPVSASTSYFYQFASGYQMYVEEVDANGVITSSNGWMSQGGSFLTTSTTAKLAIAIKIDDVTTIQPSQVTAANPSVFTSNITAAAVTGSGMSVGNYIYNVSYVTGYKKTDAAGTIIYAGEAPGGDIAVATTTGNQKVTLSGLPTTWPANVVAIRIYRTAVGGADGTQKLVTTITVPSATYSDTLADGSLGTAVPTKNTTGTQLGANNQSIMQFAGLISEIDTRTVSITRDSDGNVTRVDEQDNGVTVRSTAINRNTDSTVSTVVQTVGARTITITINYNSDGTVASVTKSVV